MSDEARDQGTIETTRRAYWFYGDLVTVHVSGVETNGRFCLVEFLKPPGEWTPLHVHKDSDQMQYVLEGELTVHLPGKSVVVGQRECINTPANVPHTECDEFVAAAGQPATELTLPPTDRPPPDIERLAALAAGHQIELLGPPGSLP
jgi:mannose-6-phosphate isomerase-like protein (cupin superfamily)